MKTYIGSKLISAEPMDECTFLERFRNETTENRETRPGYHVVSPNPGGEYHSWSPEEVFGVAYREITEEEKNLI